MARTPVQEAIARGLGVHTAEQTSAAAERSAAPAAEDARHGLMAQAKADLREIVTDAHADLLVVEPAATSEEKGDERGRVQPSFSLAVGQTKLRIELWDKMTASRPTDGDTMVLAGCVTIANPRYSKELNAVNVAYEQVGDRLAWQIYKFQGMWAPPDRYDYGPYGRTHGMSEGSFLEPRERYVMLHSFMGHPWNKTISALAAETLLGLFQEAVALRPPDPRTGIWPS